LEITVEAIDKLRERANLSYRQAKEILEETGGDLVEALIYVEENSGRIMRHASERGKEFYRRARKVASDLHQTKVKIKVRDSTLVELPVTAGALGAALFPKIAALGIIGLLVSRGSLEVGGLPAGEMAEAETEPVEH
jgi:predicted transcriptional regulator